MFADDTSLIRTLSNPYADIQIANADLPVKQISKWAKQRRVTLNAHKTVYMIFTNKVEKTERCPRIIFNGNMIEKVSNHTHLGITLNETL